MDSERCYLLIKVLVNSIFLESPRVRILIDEANNLGQHAISKTVFSSQRNEDSVISTYIKFHFKSACKIDKTDVIIPNI